MSTASKGRTLKATAFWILWPALYYILGAISLSQFESYSQVSFVWLPAGVSITAFLCTSRTRWLPLFVLLFVARLLLDVQFDHEIGSAVLFALVALGSDVACVWCVRRYARPNDDLNAIVVWIAATVGTTAIAALIGVSWLAHAYGLLFVRNAVVWWAANITGVFFGTVMLMGWMGFGKTQASAGVWSRIATILALALLTGISWYVLGQQDSELISPSWRFASACAPVALAVFIAINGGNRAGSLALFILGAVVIFYSSQPDSFFEFSGVSAGDSQLLAQVYLSATALLLAFLRVLTGTLSKTDVDLHAPDSGLGYRLDLSTSRMQWDAPQAGLRGLLPQAMDTVDEVLLQVHPDDRAGLQARWFSAGVQPISDVYAFRILNAGGEWMRLLDAEPVFFVDDEQGIVVGNWHRIRSRIEKSAP